MKAMLNKLFNHIQFNRVHIIKTLLINFFYLPFNQAIKFPILIRGKSKLVNPWKGKIIINGPIKTGMIQIGNSDPVRSFFDRTFINIEGTLIISQGVVLRRGMKLFVRESATLELKQNVVIGDNCTIICWDYIQFKEYMRCGNNTQFMDTDFHYVLNRTNNTIKDNHARIIIEANCWIGAWCVIKKGSHLPKGTIVAGPYSMISKDYTPILPEFSMIAGSPAKLIVSGYQRIENVSNENMLKSYFSTTTTPYVLDESIDLTEFCTTK